MVSALDTLTGRTATSNRYIRRSMDLLGRTSDRKYPRNTLSGVNSGLVLPFASILAVFQELSGR